MSFRQILRTSRNRDDVLRGKREWFQFQNQTGPEATINIYSEIGFFGITADDFIAELNAVSAPSINLHLNSPGGDVFDGIAIYNALVQHQASVNVVVDSIAASIASVIAMAGDTVTMTRGSMMMIHEPFALTIGDARDMRKTAEALDKMGDSIADIYASGAGGEVEDWRAVMAEETWYTAQEAVDAGLADAVKGQAAKNTFDLSIFQNVQNAKQRAQQEAGEPVSTAVSPVVFSASGGTQTSSNVTVTGSKEGQRNSDFDEELERDRLRVAEATLEV